MAGEIAKYAKMQFLRWEKSVKVEADIAVICGDRFETVDLAFTLNLNHIPVAHLSGGDITEGSQDDCFRHAITKLSHLHFPTSKEAFHRVLQMGEEPWRVHMCGSPSIDNLRSLLPISREVALWHVGLKPTKFVLVCLHPNTLGKLYEEINELHEYLTKLPYGMGKVFIGPNADEGADKIIYTMLKWSEELPNSAYVKAVPRPVFLSLMKHCEEMVGNSSAMLYEAPTLGTKCVMIGDRQQGRKPIYGDGKASQRISKVLCSIQDPPALLRKKFVDLNYAKNAIPSKDTVSSA